jgi:hypothetical protein
VPTVTVQLTEELRALATARAQQSGVSIDELYAEAIDRHLEVTKHASAGALRSRHRMSRSSPHVTIEIPQELFERAEQRAARLESGATSCTRRRWPSTSRAPRRRRAHSCRDMTCPAARGGRRALPERTLRA